MLIFLLGGCYKLDKVFISIIRLKRFKWGNIIVGRVYRCKVFGDRAVGKGVLNIS